MQVFVENPNTIVIDVDQGRQGRGISNITYTEVSGQYFLIVTYTDGTTETLGPLVVTGGAAFLLGGTAGAIPYQSAPNTTTFLPIGTSNQVVVAGASAPQYTSNLTGLTVNNTPVGNTTPSTGAFTNLSASGTFALTGDQVQISEGGTGQTTANAAFNALAPSQTGNAGKYLKTDGTNSAWDQLDISTADITGTLPIANGGTGQTTANSALNALLPTQSAQSGKYLKTDGTNASWDQLDISTADITGVLPVANGGTGASTAPGARANLSAAVLGTNNDITSMTGVTGGISSPDFVQFDTTAAATNAVGKVYWDAAQGTLDVGLLGGNVITRIGQTLVAFVTNAEAVTITKGQVVYLFGAQGDRATVKLAYNTSDATSAKTFGVVAENIGPNQTGFVMCQGVLEGLNLGAFTAGDTLYLGATPGSLTATKPYAPNHLVYVGLVERANAGNGQLYVKVQNGYELDEIHNVQIVSPQNGQTILYDASTSLWKNANLTAGTGVSVTNGAASVTIGNTGVLSFSGGTTGLTPATSTTGAVTLGGTLAVASGGTGATTAGGALTNLGAASSAITISAGTGLTGGGDLTANRTLSIANTAVTPAAYGSASSVGTFTVNAQGQLTAAASTPIAIANAQVSGLGTMSTQNSNSVTITGGSITGITDLAIADGGTGASDAPTARTNLGLGTSATLNAGVALGVATLDAGGTVPLTQLPASIQGGVSYQGSWNAATNTPTITSGVGSKGYYYVVSVAGSTNIDGITDWLPGDWIIYNGTVWQKIDNTDAVASVNGYTGVVVLSAADVGAPPTSRTITAGTGLTGGGDLSANRTISIANTTVSAGAYGSASSVGTFTVNGQGQLTAAASTPIAITNTQVSGLGTMSTQNASAVAITGGTVDGTAIGGTTRSTGAFTTLTLTNALSVANGGTGTTTSTGTGSVVLSSSPTLTTPNLGTPSAVTLTNGTGLPLTTGVTGTLPIANGGTGQTTANAAFNALAPSQTGNSGKYLTTDGTNTSWATNPLGTVTSVDVSGGTTGLTTSGGPITSSGTITLAGTLATTNGGTGLTSFSANQVFYASSTSAVAQSSNLQFSGTDLTVYGITVGRGAGAVSTNTAVGASALASNIGGQNNIAVGTSALAANTNGLRNVAVGLNSLYLSTTASDNTGVGNGSLGANTTGANNVAVGSAALISNTTASNNTAVGYQAAYTGSTATAITAVGYRALYANTGNYNSAFGLAALQNNTSGTFNNAFGTTDNAVTATLGSNTTGSYNNAFGNGALATNSTGSYNLAFGHQALVSNTTASNNTAVGYQAGYSNTTGTQNVALGAQSLRSVTTGGSNTAIGYASQYGTTTAFNNVSMGDGSMYANTTGANNIGIGIEALRFNTTASWNAAVGYQAGYSNTTGLITAVGSQALYANTTGVNNVAVGGYTSGSNYAALTFNTTGSNNTAIGNAALQANTTASNNTAVGFTAGYNNTTGTPNAFFGVQAGFTNTTGTNNTFIGPYAAYYNTTGAQNTAVGSSALLNNTTASNNTAVGFQAGYSNTTGVVTAVGYQAGYSVTTGDVLAIGNSAGRSVTTAAGNSFVGLSAGYSTTTGNNNTVMGGNVTGVLNPAFYSNTTGTENAAFGNGSLTSNTTGSANTAIGSRALAFNTTASNNTAVGYRAGYSNTTGTALTFVGLEAGLSGTTAIENTGLGYRALTNATTGSYNTAVGTNSGAAVTTGAANTSLGRSSLQTATTSSDNTAIGYRSMISTTTGGANTALGSESLQANTTGVNLVALGYGALYSNTTGANNTAVGYNAGRSETTGGSNTFLGLNAGYTQNGGGANTFIGREAGLSVTTGSYNTFVGAWNGSGNGSGSAMTTGSKNTILGGYTGNQGGLDIRTANNVIVLSDGDGNPVMFMKTGQTVALEGANSVSGTGINFPATQNASSNANTLDDYERGTWTPTMVGSGGGSTTPTQAIGTYTKIGNTVRAYCYIVFPPGTLSGTLTLQGFPFAAAEYEGACVTYWNGFSSSFVNMSVYMIDATTNGTIIKANAASTTMNSSLNASDLGGVLNEILVTLVYQTTA